MNRQHPTALNPSAKWLGYAGLLPQLLAVTLAYNGGEMAFVALAAGFAYAAAIFSFLGGVWWGQALSQQAQQETDVDGGAEGSAGAGAFFFAVMPSLIAVAAFIPWTLGWSWPGPALIFLGLLIALSPLVDHHLGLANPAFKRLRLHLSLGLGGLTIVLGVIAEQIV